MTIKLTSLEPRVAPSGIETKTPGQAQGSAAVNGAAREAQGADFAESRPAELTEASRRLAEWIREDQTSAGVDQAKVARLRVEIEHGTYRLDSTRIAEGLLTSEKELLRLMDRG